MSSLNYNFKESINFPEGKGIKSDGLQILNKKNGNLFIGANSGLNNNSAGTNISIGANTMLNSDGGSFNICIGHGVGRVMTNACQQNILLGTNNGLAGLTNIQDVISIGTTSMNDSDNYLNCIILGDGGGAGVVSGNNNVGPKAHNLYIRTFGGSVPDSETGYIRIQDISTTCVACYIGGINNSNASGTNRLMVSKNDNRLESIPDGSANQILQTNGSGTISWNSNLTLPGALIGNVTTTSGPGAVAITGTHHAITTTGTGNALTLADGVNGQVLKIVYVAEGAGGDTAILTPTNFGNGTTLTFNAIGDSAELVFTASKWWIVSLNAAVVA